MDNERTTPEGDGDDPLRELEQLEEASSARTELGVVPPSYGAPGGAGPKD